MKPNRQLSTTSLMLFLILLGAPAGFAVEQSTVDGQEASATIVVDGMMKAKSGAT